MKKLLILILIALLLALTGIIVINGVEFGSLEILGIRGIQEESEKLDDKIQEAGKLAQKDFQQAVKDVEDNSKKLKETKAEYDEMTAISSASDVESAAQLEKYEIETLCVKLGNHATNEGATMKMDVTQGSNTTQNTYNLNFTVNGSYIAITDFISDIENDDELVFKIEEFKMTPSGSDLQATFTCKDILIKKVEQTTTTAQDTTNTTNNTNSTNSTNNTANNTNSTNNTNTANTTNTTNTANTTD